MNFNFPQGRKVLLGVVHLRPLPGSPRWKGDLEAVLKAALRDARAYEAGGADAVVIENFGDVPFSKGSVGPETVAAMSAAGRAVRTAIRLPIGFNVLRNDACAGLALCAACGGSFIRVNVLTGAMLTDQGIIEGKACEVLRYREAMRLETKILADVQVKHAVSLAPMSLAQSARDTLERGLADALILTGPGTGAAADPRQLEEVRAACPAATILIGSGITEANAARFLPLANGAIVGTSVKRGGDVRHPVDERRVARLAALFRKTG